MAAARVVRTLLAAALFLVGLVPAAEAQIAEGAEIAGGYQLPSSVGPLSPQGWFLAGAFNVTRVFAAVGEVSVAGDRVAVNLPELGDFDFLPEGDALEVGGQDVTVMGGVRAAYRRRPVMLFTQFLVGMERVTSDLNFFGVESVNLTDSGLSLQVGGGVDIDITERFAIRLLGDWRRARLGGEPATAVLGGTLLPELPVGPDDAELPAFNFDTRRFAIGAVYRFGRR